MGFEDSLLKSLQETGFAGEMFMLIVHIQVLISTFSISSFLSPLSSQFYPIRTSPLLRLQPLPATATLSHPQESTQEPHCPLFSLVRPSKTLIATFRTNNTHTRKSRNPNQTNHDHRSTAISFTRDYGTQRSYYNLSLSLTHNPPNL